MTTIPQDLETSRPALVVPKVQKPPICPVFQRLTVLLISLAICIFGACTLYAWGLTWIIQDQPGYEIPLITCPALVSTFTTNYATAPSGPVCELQMVKNAANTNVTVDAGITPLPSDASVSQSLNTCREPESGEESYVCLPELPCDQVCRRVDDEETYIIGTCPDPATLPEIGNDRNQPGIEKCQVRLTPTSDWDTVFCKEVAAHSYCSNEYNMTPSNILAMRGIFLAGVIIMLVWFIAECILRYVDIQLRKEKAQGMARMAVELPQKKEFMRQQLEGRWQDEYHHAMMGGDTSSVTGTVYDTTPRESTLNGGGSVRSTGSGTGEGGRRTQLNSRNPEKRFESNTWRRRLTQWKQLRESKNSTYRTRHLMRTMTLNVFFLLLLTGTLYAVLYFSPQNIVATNKTMLEAFYGNIAIWNVYTWLDLIIFVDVLLDTFLFLIACIFVKWPAAPVFSRHLQASMENANAKQQSEAETAPGRNGGAAYGDVDADGHNSPMALSDGLMSDDTESSDSASLAFVLKQTLAHDCCLMIACHMSSMTEERYDTFTGTLRAALMVFPPSHIFVCDNGPGLHPADETQWATQQVHPDINYVYTPEGNKTFAFYWCNKYWIPFLAQNGRVADFKYAVMIDDDVPLPADLHIPHEQLRANPNIKAVHFPITAASPDGKPGVLVNCQDMEYKMAAVHKLFQALMARALACHGAIALWDREALDEVFYDHDCVFNGEDMYMGISLLRKRDESTIISCAQTVVPTYAPDQWTVLFRQRVKSWDLTSHKKTFTYLFEILHPKSLCHGASWVLKPYFLQEFLAILLDWLRIFLLCGLLLRDWIGLLLMTCVFTALLYFQVAVFQIVVLRDRRDLKSSCCTFILFPWYRLQSLMFRLCALCQNLLVYSHERANIKIGVREDEIRDIPPCPPHPDVDWFDVWVESDQVVRPERDSSQRSSSYRR